LNCFGSTYVFYFSFKLYKRIGWQRKYTNTNTHKHTHTHTHTHTYTYTHTRATGSRFSSLKPKSETNLLCPALLCSCSCLSCPSCYALPPPLPARPADPALPCPALPCPALPCPALPCPGQGWTWCTDVLLLLRTAHTWDGDFCNSFGSGSGGRGLHSSVT
jgi:hypothetical protein